MMGCSEIQTTGRLLILILHIELLLAFSIQGSELHAETLCNICNSQYSLWFVWRLPSSA